MEFKSDFLRAYMASAPLPLAFERTLECRIHARQRYERPVLDLGCGDGLFAHILFAGPVDTGVDPNARELKHARRLGSYRELVRCKGDQVARPDASYRTIFSNSVLEHIPDLPPVLREMRRLLAPGGRFYVTVPSDRFDSYALMRRALLRLGLVKTAAFYRRWFWKLYNMHPREQWEEIFRQNGFKVITSFEYDPPRICTLNSALVPFSFFAFLCKKITNRWTWFAPARRVLFYPLYRVMRRVLEGADRFPGGGLVFLALAKEAH